MSESFEENTCVVCFKGVEIYSIGQCDHPVCFECSTRMRVLCLQNECPICRQDMPKVVFIREVQPFEKIKHFNHDPDEKFKVAFTGRFEREAYDKLLAHECPECFKISPNFNHLRDHVRRVHQLNYCDLCVDNLKILTRERRCYNRRDLALHRRVGDEDDRSHRGHPICEFCDRRYVDNDELYRHLRRNHLFCHFCDADGYHHYYKSYDDLRHHFKSDHYICEEGDCYLEKFTSVFRTDIDLKAHKASVHGKGLGKAGLKQARTLDIEFTLAPRPRANQRHRFHQRDDEFDNGAVGGTDEFDHPQAYHQPQQPLQPQPERPLSFHQINTDCIDEFPALGRAPQAPPTPSITGGGLSRKVTSSFRSRGPGLLNDENFPALGPESGPVPVAGTLVSLRVNTERPAPPSSVSIQVSHPRFTTTVTSKNNYNYQASNFPALDRGETAVSVTQPPAPPGTVSSTSVQWSTKKSKQAQSQQAETAKAPSQKRSNIAPLKSDDFPALAPKENKPPPERSSSSGNKAPSVTPVETSSASSKNKKKKSKSKSASSSDAGTNVKKKNPPPEPPPLSEQSYNELPQSSAMKKSKEDKSVSKQATSGSKETTKKPVASNEKKTVKPNIKIDESSFPVLGGKAPPPGFEAKWQVRRPPPGLETVTPTAVPVVTPPPGFQPSNGAFPPLLEQSYIPPPNFEERNSALVGKVIKAVGEDSLKNFKDFSVGYRDGFLSAEQYYDHCRDVMGSETFISLFPELLALLPDVAKQKDLWPLYQKDKRLFEKSPSGKKNMLDACALCGQVLKASDSPQHSTQHTRDDNFPTLNSSVPNQRKPNAWAK